MTCIICHGEEIEVREIQEEVRIGEDIIYVRIRTPVCQTCGERYYDRRTMRHLEEVEQRLKDGEGEVQEVGRVLKYG